MRNFDLLSKSRPTGYAGQTSADRAPFTRAGATRDSNLSGLLPDCQAETPGSFIPDSRLMERVALGFVVAIALFVAAVVTLVVNIPMLDLLD